MKKAFFILTAASLFFAHNCFAIINIDKIYDKYQIVYLPSSNSFTTGSMQDDRIVLRKAASVGTGGYSTYFYSNGHMAFKLPTNFEFIKDSRLIACDNAYLKYHEVYYKQGKFYMKDVSFEEMAQMFPNAEVVKISDFKNKKLTIETKKDYILLFNDTDEYFYKYTTSPKEIESTDIKGLIDVSKVKTMTFSHYGDDNEMYKKYEIVIK